MVNEQDALRQTYDRIADDWHRDHQDDTWWIDGTDTFISFLKPGDLVLDVGCGGGTKAKYLIDRGLEVTGIDFAENLIAIAKREVPTGTFIVMDAYDLDALPGTFDGVLAQAFLLHVPKRDVSAVLGKLTDKVRPGGYLYMAVKEVKPGQPEEEERIENDYGYEYRRFFSYFTLPELEGLIRQTGLETAYSEITPSGNSRWIHLIGQRA